MKTNTAAKEFVILGTFGIKNILSSIRDAIFAIPIMAILYRAGFVFKDILLNRDGACNLAAYENILWVSLTRYTISEAEQFERRRLPRSDSRPESYNIARERSIFRVKSRTTYVLDKKIAALLPPEFEEYAFIQTRQYQSGEFNSGDLYTYKKYQIYYPPQRIPKEKYNKTVGYICFFHARQNEPALLNLFTPSKRDTAVFGMLLLRCVWDELDIDLTSTSHNHFAMIQFSSNYAKSLMLSDISKVDYEVILNISFSD